MSKKLLAITFLVSLVVTLIGFNSVHASFAKNSTDTIIWILPTGVGLGMMMICGIIGIRKFFGALAE